MRRRGSTLLEGSLVITTFIFLLVGATDCGRFAFTTTSITYAAHQAARFAATNGSSSGHAASVAAIQSNAENNLVGLSSSALTVNVTWNPNNNPGSQVQVVVSYGFQPLLVPMGSKGLTLKSTAVDVITQ